MYYLLISCSFNCLTYVTVPFVFLRMWCLKLYNGSPLLNCKTSLPRGTNKVTWPVMYCHLETTWYPFYISQIYYVAYRNLATKVNVFVCKLSHWLLLSTERIIHQVMFARRDISVKSKHLSESKHIQNVPTPPATHLSQITYTLQVKCWHLYNMQVLRWRCDACYKMLLHTTTAAADAQSAIDEIMNNWNVLSLKYSPTSASQVWIE